MSHAQPLGSLAIRYEMHDLPAKLPSLWHLQHRHQNGSPGSHRGKAVVDEEMRAVDETRLVAREKQRSARHLLWLANAALLNGKGRIRHVDTKLVELGNLAQAVRRAHEPRADGVAADVLVAILDEIGRAS